MERLERSGSLGMEPYPGRAVAMRLFRRVIVELDPIGGVGSKFCPYKSFGKLLKFQLSLDSVSDRKRFNDM